MGAHAVQSRRCVFEALQIVWRPDKFDFDSRLFRVVLLHTICLRAGEVRSAFGKVRMKSMRVFPAIALSRRADR